MRKKLNEILARLEKIEENQIGQLQGGFVSFGSGENFAAGIFNKNCPNTCGNSNCYNQNCVKGCGRPVGN